jgi:predicted DNA-binding transcriptional regulator AlpA
MNKSKLKLHDDDELIDSEEVRALFDNPHRSTIWRWVKAGLLPPPVKVGPNTIRWWRREVLARREALPRQTYRAPEATTEAAALHSP